MNPEQMARTSTFITCTTQCEERTMKISRLLFVPVMLTLLFTLAACVPIAAPAAGDGTAAVPCNQATVQEVDGRPDLGGCVLRVAVENAYQPFNYLDPETGEAVGYDYDIFAEFCARVNCQLEYHETSWDAMVAVMAGEGTFESFDVAADGITITEERAQNVDFSDPYVSSTQVLLAQADEERFTGPEDFAADPTLRIGTQLGTTNYYVALDLVGEDRIVAYDQFGTAVQALINGDVDAVMIDNVGGIGYVGVNADQLKVVGDAVQSEELGVVFSKGSPITDAFNWALAEMEADGTLDDLTAKWFSPE
jgi:polar amino acid transport system substrate-binding protein